MTFTDGALIAGLLTMGVGLVKVVEKLVDRRGEKRNGKLSEEATQALLTGQTELKSGMMSINQKVQDRDGVPLAFHLREHTAIMRAMLARMETTAEQQRETTAIQKTILEKLDK